MLYDGNVEGAYDETLSCRSALKGLHNALSMQTSSPRQVTGLWRKSASPVAWKNLAVLSITAASSVNDIQRGSCQIDRESA